jgi:DNA polymerase
MNIPCLETVIGEIKDALISLSGAGCPGFDCTEASLVTLADWGKPAPSPVETLEMIREDLGDCRRCGLSAGRKNIVFGTGSDKARLMFIGEGPGQEEDRQGEPFVGAAGQLLTKIIQAISLTRESVYIANAVKCRPPGNRNPLPDEIGPCLPFLKRQIASVDPDFICTLGSVATHALLGTDAPISALRGKLHPFGRIRVMPTYHPAYLLRNPEKKRDVWEDMKKLMAELVPNVSHSS